MSEIHNTGNWLTVVRDIRRRGSRSPPYSSVSVLCESAASWWRAPYPTVIRLCLYSNPRRMTTATAEKNSSLIRSTRFAAVAAAAAAAACEDEKTHEISQAAERRRKTTTASYSRYRYFKNPLQNSCFNERYRITGDQQLDHRPMSSRSCHGRFDAPLVACLLLLRYVGPLRCPGSRRARAPAHNTFRRHGRSPG